MRSGRVRIFNGNQRETLYLTHQERIGMGFSNLVSRGSWGPVGILVAATVLAAYSVFRVPV